MSLSPYLNRYAGIILQASKLLKVCTVKDEYVTIGVEIGDFVSSLLTLIQPVIENINKLTSSTPGNGNLNNVISQIYDDYSICLNANKRYEDAFEASLKSMENSQLTEEYLAHLRSNQFFIVSRISSRYNSRPDEVIKQLTCSRERNIHHLGKAVLNPEGIITVTMTTCKRFRLFVDTVNSFLSCCLDLFSPSPAGGETLIYEWLVVDDNSPEDERIKMKELFPFITFVYKTPDQKGHSESMNLILSRVTTPYVFHLEDDWLFFRKERYFERCLATLNENNTYGQCLLNRIYGETEVCHNSSGGIMRFTTSSSPTAVGGGNGGRGRYYIHEFYTGKELEEKLVGVKKHCYYWPHFSLRVGLTRTSVLREIGLFTNDKTKHFEMEYAYRYVGKGYKTVYFDNIYCLHTGRKTWERGDLTKENAYSLNDQEQFGDKKRSELLREAAGTLSLSDQLTTTVPTQKYRVVVINLDRRPDRFEKFNKLNEKALTSFKVERYSGVDGKLIKPDSCLFKLFEPNDYYWRCGIIGCAYSHINLWYKLIFSQKSFQTLFAGTTVEDNGCLLILEDDVKFAPNFWFKLNLAMRKLPKNDWDVLFLGHFLYEDYKRPEYFNPDENPEVERWHRGKCVKMSMGGNFGYLISRRGAMKMLIYLNLVGMPNAIDWMVFKSATENEADEDGNKVFYCNPHVVYSECLTEKNRDGFDSDIQKEYGSLFSSIDSRLLKETGYWAGKVGKEKVKFNKLKEVGELGVYFNGSKERLTQVSIFELLTPTPEGGENRIIRRELKGKPLYYYSLSGFRENQTSSSGEAKTYVIVVPEIYISKEVVSDITFEGNYLNVLNVSNNNI